MRILFFNVILLSIYLINWAIALFKSSIALLSPHSIASTMHPSICSCNIILLTPFNADITAAN